MKELLLQNAHYNTWANKRVIDVLLKLEDHALDQEIVSSFPSLRATVSHTWSAEYIWLQRLQLAENPLWVESEFRGSMEQACNEWQNVSTQLIQFTERQYDDSAFGHVLQYYDRKKTSHKTPVFQVLQHVFNHSTYHRGQMITMLRQAWSKEIFLLLILFCLRARNRRQNKNGRYYPPF